MNGREGHLPSLTALRGIAALCVLLHHLTAYFLPVTGEILAGYTGFFLRSYLWVDFFFILSGFLIAHIYQNSVHLGGGRAAYFAFLRARFARLYPLHLLTLLAMLGWSLAVVAAEIRTTGLDAYLASENYRALRFHGNDTPISFVRHLLLLQTLNVGGYTDWNGPAWSIGAEWIAYCVFPLIATAALARPKLMMLVGIPLGFGGVATIAAFFGGSIDVGGVYGTARCLCEFVLGVGLLQVFRCGVFEKFLARDMTLAIVAVATLFTLHCYVRVELAVVALALLVLVGAHNRGVAARWLESAPLRWCGEVSFAVYMVHWPMLTVWRWLWRGVFQSPFGEGLGWSSAFLFLGAGVAVVYVVANLVWRRFEMPWRERLRGPSH